MNLKYFKYFGFSNFRLYIIQSRKNFQYIWYILSDYYFSIQYFYTLGYFFASFSQCLINMYNAINILHISVIILMRIWPMQKEITKLQSPLNI